MAATPVFITQYELLRSQDYVLITLSAPSGKVADGRMQTEDVQRVALTIPRFLEFAATMGQMADNIRLAINAGRPAQPPSKTRRAERRAVGDAPDDDEPGLKGPADWVSRH
jgi:hypothetical protein